MGAISRLLLNNFEFSTSEKKTNLKWIDGKDIYVKTDAISSQNPQNLSLPLPTGCDTLVDWQAVIDVGGSQNNIKNAYYSGQTSYMFGYTSQGNFHFATGTYSSISSGHMTWFYTKT